MVLGFIKSPALRVLLGVLFLLVSFSASSATLYKYAGTGTTNAEWISWYAGCTTEVAAFCAAGGSCYEGHGAPNPSVDPVPRGTCYYYNSSAQARSLNNWSTISGSCPAGYVEDPVNGHCVPAPQCPSGTVNVGTTENPDCADICVSGTVRSGTFEFALTPNQGIDELGCVVTKIPQDEYSCTATEPMVCTVLYSQTGEYAGTDNIWEITPLPDAESAEKTNIKEQDKTPEQVTTDPDGNVTTEYTESEKITNDVGSEVVQIGDNLYRIDSTGQIVEIVKQHEINSYIDGTGQETITETLTKIPASITETIKDLVSGDVTGNNYTEGPSGSKTTMITKVYDSSGVLVSSDTISTGSIDSSCTGDCGDGDGDGEGGSYSMYEGQGNYDDATAEAQTAKSEALASLSTKFNSIKSEMQSMFSFSGSGSGFLPCPPPITYNVGIRSGQFDICLTTYESQLSIVAIILIFIASFLAIAIILR